MHRFFITLVFPMAFFASFAVVDAAGIDLHRFSVEQFKLYMTPAEVLSIAGHSQYHIKIDRNACARDAMVEIKKKRRTQLLYLAHQRCIRMITLSQNRGAKRAELWFVEDFPQHPNTMRLYSIHIYEKDQSIGSRQKLEQTLVAQYGAPTVREQDVAAWCNNSEERECVYSMEFVPAMNELGTADFAFMQSVNGQLSGLSVQGLPSADHLDNDVEIELFDVPYAAVRAAAISKAYDAILGVATH